MEDKLLFSNEWVSVFERDGWYTYTHSNRTGLVCVVPYRNDKEYPILGRYEICPPHNDGNSLTSITGSIEKGEVPISAALRELKEESGYIQHREYFTYLGMLNLSKQSDEICYLYGVSLNRLYTKIEATQDGTKGEEGSYCKWISYEEAVKCKEPCMQSALLRLQHIHGINLGAK